MWGTTEVEATAKNDKMVGKSTPPPDKSLPYLTKLINNKLFIYKLYNIGIMSYLLT